MIRRSTLWILLMKRPSSMCISIDTPPFAIPGCIGFSLCWGALVIILYPLLKQFKFCAMRVSWIAAICIFLR